MRVVMTESVTDVPPGTVARASPTPPPPPRAGTAAGEVPAGPPPTTGSPLVEGSGDPKGGIVGVRVGSGNEIVGVGRTLTAPAATGIPISKMPARKTNPATRTDATVERYTTLMWSSSG
jgi:hypothetical protein